MKKTLYAVSQPIDFALFGSFLIRNVNPYTQAYTPKTSITIDEVKKAFNKLTFFLSEDEANTFATLKTTYHDSYLTNPVNVLFSPLLFVVKISRVDNNTFKVDEIESIKTPTSSTMKLPSQDELTKIDLSTLTNREYFSLFSTSVSNQTFVTAKNFKGDFSLLHLNIQTVTFILCHKLGLLNDAGASQSPNIKSFPNEIVREICSYTMRK